MKCINPRKLINPARTGFDDYYIIASCGKCYACLANRRRSWLFRLKNEEMASNFSVFVTFTYNDDSCDGCLHKSHLQNFIKRLRHSHKFTYYAIGEFGTTTFRPHYHAIFFFKDKEKISCFNLQKEFEEKWKLGFVSVKKCSYRRLNYVLHYHTRPKIVNNKMTFQIFSKGMGITFIEDSRIIDYLLVNNTALVKSLDGGTFVIPRYYRKKLSDLYNIDLKCEVDTIKTSVDEMLEKIFDRPLYQISEEEKVTYIHSLLELSDCKIKKYNNQDKFI